MFQKSRWRSSRRFVDKWTVGMYIGGAALRCTFWNRRRGVECRLFQKPSRWNSRRFVDEVPHISHSGGTVKVLERLAIWLVLGVAVCFKTASTWRSELCEEALNDHAWNTGHTTTCRMFQNSAWRCTESFATRRWTGYFWKTRHHMRTT